MKKMMSFSMATLVAMGAILSGCAKNGAAEPEIKDNIVTVTTTIGLGENDATKALDIDYVNKKVTKTFAEGDQVALEYSNESDQRKRTVATAENISADGKSASFTFTLVNPKAGQTVSYYYPASLVNESASLVIPLETQDGTLGGVESLDYAYDTGDMSGTTLPASVTLENQFAIVAFILKDATGANDITGTITGMTIHAGANTYNITGHDADGHIYVVMVPITDTEFTVTATDGTKNYTKSVSAKTYKSNNFYQQGLLMAELQSVSAGGTLGGGWVGSGGDAWDGSGSSGGSGSSIGGGWTGSGGDAWE